MFYLVRGTNLETPNNLNIPRFENSEHLDMFLKSVLSFPFLGKRSGNGSFGKPPVKLRWKSPVHCKANRETGVNLFTLGPYKKEIKFMKEKLPQK